MELLGNNNRLGRQRKSKAVVLRCEMQRRLKVSLTSENCSSFCIILWALGMPERTGNVFAGHGHIDIFLEAKIFNFNYIPKIEMNEV